MTARCLTVFLVSILLLATDLNAQSPEGEIKSGSIQLFNRSVFDDYEKSTFSFALGIRDDTTGSVGNDWDLHYASTWRREIFQVRMVTDDRSVIVDLGDVEFKDLKELPTIPTWINNENDQAAVIDGHTYLVHTKDTDSDHISLFRVKKMEAGKNCTIDWIHWIPGPQSKQLELSAQTKKRLGDLFQKVVVDKRTSERKRIGFLDPVNDIVMQIKTGARGGNPARLNLKGETYRLDEAASSDELDFGIRPNIRDEGQYFLKGGYIPDGKALVITAIDVFGSAAGDSNGHGEAVLIVGKQKLLTVRDVPNAFRLWFEGKAVFYPGEEEEIKIEVANSSALDVRIKGQLIALKEAKTIEEVELTKGEAPKDSRRAGGGEEVGSLFIDGKSDIVLQIKTGAQGGNRSRLDMQGGTYRIDELSNKGGLNFAEVPEMDDDATHFFQGGKIPPNKVFFVKAIDVYAYAKGDSNGPGEVTLKVGRVDVFKIRDNPRSVRQWLEGHAIILPGQEDDVRLEVGNSSAVDVRIKGELVDRKELAKIKMVPFKKGDAPQGVERAGGDAEAVGLFIDGKSDIVLQIKTGAQGGNRSRLDMQGGTYRIDEPSKKGGLDFAEVPEMDDDATHFFQGGKIPPNKVFIVKAIDVYACAKGDSNGPGEVTLKVGRVDVFKIRNNSGPVRQWLEGHAMILPGQEDDVRLEVGNSSAVDVRIKGVLVDRKELALSLIHI